MVVVVGAIATGIRNFIFSLSGYRLVYRLRSVLFRTIISQETAFFDESKTGELLNRLSADTQVMQSSITQNISMFLRSMAQGFLAMVLMFMISWKLTFAVLAVVPLLIIFASIYG